MKTHQIVKNKSFKGDKEIRICSDTSIISETGESSNLKITNEDILFLVQTMKKPGLYYNTNIHKKKQTRMQSFVN